jgi:hypothetical protein
VRAREKTIIVDADDRRAWALVPDVVDENDDTTVGTWLSRGTVLADDDLTAMHADIAAMNAPST